MFSSSTHIFLMLSIGAVLNIYSFAFCILDMDLLKSDNLMTGLVGLGCHFSDHGATTWAWLACVASWIG